MKKSILVVEDDEAIRMACEQALTYWGHEVHTAEDGSEALERLRQLSGRVDLILLDSMMPKMTGEQFVAAQETHPAWRKIPVVVMSAQHELPAPLARKRMLRKPMNLQDLLGAVSATAH